MTWTHEPSSGVQQICSAWVSRSARDAQKSGWRERVAMIRSQIARVASSGITLTNSFISHWLEMIPQIMFWSPASRDLAWKRAGGRGRGA